MHHTKKNVCNEVFIFEGKKQLRRNLPHILEIFIAETFLVRCVFLDISISQDKKFSLYILIICIPSITRKKKKEYALIVLL